MADPATRVVSLTVTEGGYNIHAVTGEFDTRTPDVVHDLTEGAAPRTSFGLVVEALRRRRDRGVPPFTVSSCDNIQGNGDVARAMFGTFARLKDAGLGAWVAENVHFPNSMVDRITPQTTDDDRAQVAERFGIADGWPVVCEPFTQWVLQEDFPLGRPPYEEVGVQVVDDVEPYELMKLRLLNASHQGLCYFGYLAGYRLVHRGQLTGGDRAAPPGREWLCNRSRPAGRAAAGPGGRPPGRVEMTVVGCPRSRPGAVEGRLWWRRGQRRSGRHRRRCARSWPTAGPTPGGWSAHPTSAPYTPTGPRSGPGCTTQAAPGRSS